MSDKKSKYINVGIISKNEYEGRETYSLRLDKEFLDNAPDLIQKAKLDKNGNRYFYLFEPRSEKAPDFIKYNVCVKGE